MFVVDTNVLVYAANADAVDHEQCRRLLERWRRGSTPWYVTWAIVYEFLRVVTHRRALARPVSAAEAWAFVHAVLDSPSAGVIHEGGRHRQVLAGLVEEMPTISGNLLHDVHTVALMREHGIARIVTRDADFRRFAGLEVVDPVEA